MELWHSDILYDSLLWGTQLTNGLQLKHLWLFQHSHHGHVSHGVLQAQDWAWYRCYSPATSAWFLTLPKDNLCLVTPFQLSSYFLWAALPSETFILNFSLFFIGFRLVSGSGDSLLLLPSLLSFLSSIGMSLNKYLKLVVSISQQLHIYPYIYTYEYIYMILKFLVQNTFWIHLVCQFSVISGVVAMFYIMNEMIIIASMK